MKKFYRILLILVGLSVLIYLIANKISNDEGLVKEKYHSSVILKLFSIKTSNDFIIDIPEEKTSCVLDSVKLDTISPFAYGKFVNKEVKGTVLLNWRFLTPCSSSDNDIFNFVAPFIVNSRGSGNFYYLGFFTLNYKEQTITHKKSVYLGDRVVIKGIKLFEDTYFKVRLLKHGSKQSYAEEPKSEEVLDIKI